MRGAVELPVRITIKDVFDDTLTELLVVAQLDSGAPPTHTHLFGSRQPCSCSTSVLISASRFPLRHFVTVSSHLMQNCRLSASTRGTTF